MTKIAYLYALVLLGVCPAYAQDFIAEQRAWQDQVLALASTPEAQEFLETHDFSDVLAHDPEGILGFIGSEYQRLHLAFLSVIKNPDDPAEYLVYGKSMVQGNICSFSGRFEITGVELRASLDHEHVGVVPGRIVGRYTFYEDPDHQHVGVFRGVFWSHWHLDAENALQYDETFPADAEYMNNAFVGTWTAYGSKAARPAHWGHRRIPLSGDLDVGTSAFGPNTTYRSKGWADYGKRRRWW